MKKLVWFLLVTLLLAACGNSDEPQVTETETIESEEGGDGTQAPEMYEPKGTEDPLVVGDKTSGENYFLHEYTEYEVVERYSSNETDEKGFNSVSFKGYDYNFAVVAMKDEMDDEFVALVGEATNNTEEEVLFNSDVEIVTSNQEQAKNWDGVGESKPGVKRKAFVLVPLEYGIPDSFTLTLDPPFLKVGEYSYEEGNFGEPIEMEFTKD